MSPPDEVRVVACTLTTADLASQSARWERVRTASGIERVESADGIRLRFRADAGVTDELRALAAVENDCCSWATWTVTTPGTEVVVLATSTGDGITALHAMFPDPERLPTAGGEEPRRVRRTSSHGASTGPISSHSTLD